jgi:hypothetical protein
VEKRRPAHLFSLSMPMIHSGFRFRRLIEGHYPQPVHSREVLPGPTSVALVATNCTPEVRETIRRINKPFSKRIGWWAMQTEFLTPQSERDREWLWEQDNEDCLP